MKIKKLFRNPFKSRGNALLRQVKRLILEEPRRINMHIPQAIIENEPLVGLTGDFVLDADERFDMPPCGTVGCIAGWADAAARGGVLVNKEFQIWRNVDRRARKLLRLKKNEALALFHVSGWPFKFRYAYNEARTREKRAQVTADRIDHFIKTRE